METLSSDSRQPPDGHESPDYIETEIIQEKFSENYTDLYNGETLKSVNSVKSSQIRSSLNDLSDMSMMQPLLTMHSKNSVSEMDLSSKNADLYSSSIRSAKLGHNNTSQSLLGLSTINGDKKDRLTLLSEQRKQSYSKLKGLVIPEHVSDTNTAPMVNIPEIISHTPTSFVLETKIKTTNKTMQQCHSNPSEPVALPLSSPPWASSATTLPKYSPAFKRKSLQVYPVRDRRQDEPQTNAIINQTPVKPFTTTNPSATLPKSKPDSSDLRLDSLSDAPKSLESITSPTRSDCSFDYVTNSFNKTKVSSVQESAKIFTPKRKDSGKSEDESDNDSAVSSSQSSFISRSSPPPSPTRSCEFVDYENNRRKSDLIQDESCRMLKAASVEAINRKNILASAKCRSGKDLKGGSPVIQRKYDEEDDVDDGVLEESSSPTAISIASNSPVNQTLTLTKQENDSPEAASDVHAVEKEPKEKRHEVDVAKATATKPTSKSEQRTPNHSEIKFKTVEKPSLVNLRPVSNIPTKLQTNRFSPISDYSRSSTLLKNNNKRMSVTDIRKNFEKPSSVPSPQKASPVVAKVKISKQEIKPPTKPEQILTKKPKETEEVLKLETQKTTKTVQVRRRTSTPKEEKNTNEKNNNNKSNDSNSNKKTIVLCPEVLGGSVGLTLAGGTDYETKEITVHRIRYGSVAYNDGKLKKGDRIISINGKETTGLTHAQSVELLKESASEFIFVVEDGKEVSPATPPQRKSFILESPQPKGPALPEKTANHVVELIKDGAGLGFSIDGGKDSLQGDLPLRIKKIFQGGTADKRGELVIGDELLAINKVSLTNLSKIEAWNLMKKLPDGKVSIHIHR